MLPLLAAVGAAAAAGVAGWASMWPTSQLYGRTFLGLPGTKRLALTYDDGPNDPHTLHLLDVLAKHGVKATFFVIGRFVKQRPDILRAVAQAGHVIGNHTYSHPNLIFASPAGLRQQLDDCEMAVTDAIGIHPTLFRPPFGGRRPDTLAEVRSRGLTTVMWSVSSSDWRLHTAEEVEKTVVEQVRGGDVILMHDGAHVRMGAPRGHTVQATDRLIPRYKAEGYSFVSIPEMLNG